MEGTVCNVGATGEMMWDGRINPPSRPPAWAHAYQYNPRARPGRWGTDRHKQFLFAVASDEKGCCGHIQDSCLPMYNNGLGSVAGHCVFKSFVLCCSPCTQFHGVHESSFFHFFAQ